MTFLADRIGESISGESPPVVVTLLLSFDAKAGEVAAQLRGLPAAAHVFIKTSTGLPTLQVRLRPERLAAFPPAGRRARYDPKRQMQGAVVAQTDGC